MEVWMFFGEVVEVFVVQQFVGVVCVLQQYDLYIVFGYGFFQQWQYGMVWGNVGIGGDQQVMGVVVIGIQVELVIGVGCIDLVVLFQCFEQGCGSVIRYEIDCDIYCFVWVQCMVVDGCQ